MSKSLSSNVPLRSLDRRPSGSHGSRNRSPSSGTAFSDLAHHGESLWKLWGNFILIYVSGKKQLNQLIVFLDNKGVAVKDGLGGRDSQAQRTVRAKREAEEAGLYHFY